MRKPKINIIGGGLAGSEAAWQVAQRGYKVRLYEMRPLIGTGAHVTGYLAELVCSNSLGSNLVNRASGLLKHELRILNSVLIRCADQCMVPAGGALAVDRDLFAAMVTEEITKHPNIDLIREECKELPEGPTIIATGPLTSSHFAEAIAEFTGQDQLFFYDAIAPIIYRESVNMGIAFRSSRYQTKRNTTNDELNPGGDYINCPLEKNEYYDFVDALATAERIKLRDFEIEMENGVTAGVHNYFEGCLPVEILAWRGKDSLAFGPMRPVGLVNPHTGKRPYAVVQLRQDNLANSLYNMVGFQTNLLFSEQKRIFCMIPGLEQATIERYGQMHKNTFIFSPKILNPSLQSLKRENLFFAGQITGVEGYAGNIATGLLAGLNLVNYIENKELFVMPRTTMVGALCYYITNASEKDFQPMKANFGILPSLSVEMKKVSKLERGKLYADRSLNSLKQFFTNI